MGRFFPANTFDGNWMPPFLSPVVAVQRAVWTVLLSVREIQKRLPQSVIWN